MATPERISPSQERISPYIDPDRFLVVVDQREMALDALRNIKPEDIHGSVKPVLETAPVEPEARAEAA
jgi:hypothetical protein